MTKKYIEHIDITPWVDEYLRTEIDVTTEEKAIEAQVRERIHWLDMGAHLLAANKLGHVPEDMVPDPADCLRLGSAEAWRQRINKRTVQVEVGNSQIEVREVASVQDPRQTGEDNGENRPSYYTYWDDPKRADAAEHYLTHTLGGHVERHAAILAYHARDLDAVEGDTIATVREIFQRFRQMGQEDALEVLGG
jgi:hypothetical protein